MRNAFLQRGTVSVAALDQQMRSIDAYQSRFDEFYGSRVVQALDGDGTFVPAECIFAIIFAKPTPAAS